MRDETIEETIPQKNFNEKNMTCKIQCFYILLAFFLLPLHYL